MKATVDNNLCVGCGLCVELCPSVFAMQGSLAVVQAEPATPDAQSTCRDARDQCPVCAISLSE